MSAAPPIETATSPAHARAMAAVHALSFPAGEAWGETALADLLAMPGAFGCVDPAGAFILVRVAADEAEVLTLAVPPPLRRAGRGMALIQVALRCAGEAGARVMFLEVSRANLPAVALYRRAGFADVGVRRRYYRDGTDALLLRRGIDISPAATAVG